jgi:tetrahydromethanopterin S-methyltransferase subunit G|tara:strand:+ start:1571 stop:1789 length:219 start_codon:yes stop_codon:yes gene_type:complete
MAMENDEIRAILVKHDERLKNIYSSLNRIEKHLEKLNGKVESHEQSIAKVQVLGTVGILSFPVIINIIMRLI